MLEITLEKAGKKFRSDWIFKNLDLTLKQGEKWWIKGPNGSGKSTLLKSICGAIYLNEGSLKFINAGKEEERINFFKHFTLVAPYSDLIEEFTLQETIYFHFSFKKILEGIEVSEIVEKLMLKGSEGKYLKEFSSGMKQRVKLGLAIFSDSPLLLLDEPLMNLDDSGVKWYLDLIQQYGIDKTIVVCSNNIEAEHAFCDRQLEIINFKEKTTY